MASAVQRQFKDISLSFQKNPITNDIIVLKNETAIARSIRNLVFTQVGEKFFQPEVGSRIGGSLFELLDYGSASAIQLEIKNTINNYKPRVQVKTIEVTPEYDNNGYNVLISYLIVGDAQTPQRLEFILQATR
mgnify:CR=1 FL=1